jgi:hypothetical protein
MWSSARFVGAIAVVLLAPASAQAGPFLITYAFDETFRVAAPGATPFAYGFTSSDLNATVFGDNIQINSITLAGLADNQGSRIIFDAEAWIGPNPSGFPGGQVTSATFPGSIVSPTPVRFRVAIGEVVTEADYTFSATHNFITNTTVAAPQLGQLKEATTPLFDAPGGLYGQLFIWTGSPFHNSVVSNLTLTVAGNTPDAAPVPEPASLGLVASGIGALFYRRRARKRFR